MTRGNHWKGGRRVTERGYVMVWEPDHPLANATGYVYEHRKVVYDAGVPIPDGYHVHHIDGDRANNVLANLAVMDRESHYALHKSVGRVITNQYGTFPILSPEQRLERDRRKSREWQRARRTAHNREAQT